MEGDMQTIELDCPPGALRPWDLIEGVIEGTGLVLTERDKESGFTFFGHREWVFSMSQEQWETQVQPIIKPRIEALYHSGAIRYGSW